MGQWTVTVPEASTNLVIDPECTALNFYNATGATLTVSTAYAHNGYSCLKIVTNNSAADEGMYSDVLANGMPVTVGTTYTFSGYLRGGGTVYLGIHWQNGATTFATVTGSTITLSNTGWTRYTVSGTAPATSVTAAVVVYTKTQQSATYYIDGLQFEAKSYATTFISGNQPGCVWAGLYNASTSSRDAQYRLGGREVDLETTYGLKVKAPRGIGVPPVQNNLQNLALQPGAMFQSSKLLTRTIDLIISTQVYATDAFTTLHTRRDSLISLLAPEQYRGSQAVRIGYTGAGRTVYGNYRYDGGLEFTDLDGRNEFMPVRLIAVDPLLYEDDQGQATLAAFNMLSSNNRALARINGAWQNLGTGFNGPVYAIAYDPRSGRVYFGGSFTTANGIADINNICYWTGTTFYSMDNGVNGPVHAISIAPNGDVWVGGDFTQVYAGPLSCKGLARWNYAADDWTAFNPATTTFGSIFAIEATLTQVYIGGNFTNWNAIAAADHIAVYDGTNWAALGSGANGYVHCILNYGDYTYVGGAFTAMGGVASTAYIAYWNGSNWNNITSGCNATVYALARASNGMIYVGGAFTTAGGVVANYIARWDGYSWNALGEGFDDNVYSLTALGSALYAFGKFSTVGTLGMYSGAFWNGYVWTTLDCQLPGGTTSYASEITKEGYLFIGHDSTSDPRASGITTVNNASTTFSYPVITLTATTSTETIRTLRYLENQSTGQIVYFNLPMVYGETITIDFTPGRKSITSDWRGRIYDNPLSNSDFGNFHLLPGNNTIACLMQDVDAVTAVMNWSIQHLSVDGAV